MRPADLDNVVKTGAGLFYSLARKAALYFVLFVLAGCAQAMSGPGSSGAIVLVNLRMSPDGNVVAFEYYDTRFIAPADVRAGRKHRGLGLLEWRTDRLTRIPNPAGRQLSAPSWSYDGKRLAAAMGKYGSLAPTQIVVIDMPDFTVTEVIGKDPVKGDGHYLVKTSPVFQPETGNILYVESEYGRIPMHYRLFDPRDGNDRVVLPKEQGFYSLLSQPCFIGRDEIIFQAIGPKNREFEKIVIELASSPGVPVTYRLKFGEEIQFYFPELDRRKSVLDPQITGITASAGGRIVIGIRKSLSEPENAQGKYNLEIFRIDQGRLTQLTKLRSYLANSTVAYNGSTVAFGADPTRQRVLDLSILDMTTGTVTPTGLRKRIEQHPDFALR